MVDLEGRFLLPGFVNAHGHVDPDGGRCRFPSNSTCTTHYGVTTALSLGDEGEHMRDER